MTSEKLKPTPGPWIAHSHNNETVQANDDWTVYGPMCEVICMEGNGLPEDGANARLIAEAGTVFHECGLSPRELLALLQAIVAASESDAASGGEMFFAEAVGRPIEAARAALAKHKEV